MSADVVGMGDGWEGFKRAAMAVSAGYGGFVEVRVTSGGPDLVILTKAGFRQIAEYGPSDALMEFLDD